MALTEWADQRLTVDASDAARRALLAELSEPNNALKLLQLAELRLSDATRDDPRVPVLESWLSVVSAFALASLDPRSNRGQVHSQLAKTRDGWNPPSVHARADMDLITALTLLHLV